MFSQLKEYTDRIGTVYGTEDFAMYMYSIVKMRKPAKIVELGTGVGTTTLWMAQALKENGFGKLHTVDNGEMWAEFVRNHPKEKFPNTYQEFITNSIKQFELEDQIEFHNTDITALDDGYFGSDIDILFTDFEHYPASILTLFSLYLPYLNKNSLFLIDGASTFYPSFLLLENLVSMFNQGQVPNSLNPAIEKIVKNSKFTLNHLIENKDRHQNSTAQITINPIDIFPQPVARIRGL